MVQIARPDQDISAGSWTAIGGPSTLFDAIDEVVANDGTDYMEDAANNTTAEIGLTTLTDPVSSVDHIIRFKMRGEGSGGPERCNVQLFDGATLIAATGNQTSRAAWAEKTYTLTTAEADNIGNYGDLRLKIISSNLVGGETMWVTWAEFEVPDVPSAGLPPGLGPVVQQQQPHHVDTALSRY